MNNYKIFSFHSIAEDDYKQGELKTIKDYSLTEIVQAETVKEAIIEYFKSVIHYDFDFKHAEHDSEFLYHSTLVDSEQIEATKEEMEKWKQGRLKLYANSYSISVEQLISVDLEEELNIKN